jgi:hypothetical protein
MDIKKRGFEVLDGVYLVVGRDTLQTPVTCYLHVEQVLASQKELLLVVM